MTEYLYDVETLKRILEEEGFGEIRVFGDRKLSLPEPDEERIFVSARNMRRPEEALPAGSERSNG